MNELEAQKKRNRFLMEKFSYKAEWTFTEAEYQWERKCHSPIASQMWFKAER